MGTYRGRGEHAEAAEGTGLVAGDAGLEAGRALGAGVAEADLLLGRNRHVEEQLGRDDPASGNEQTRMSVSAYVRQAWANPRVF